MKFGVRCSVASSFEVYECDRECVSYSYPVSDRWKLVYQGSDTKDYGKELVGSKVKVWWPDDKA